MRGKRSVAVKECLQLGTPRRRFKRGFILATVLSLAAFVCGLQPGLIPLLAQELTNLETTVASVSQSPSPSLPSEVDIPPLPEETDADIPLPAPMDSQAATTVQPTESAIMSSPRRFQYAFQLTVRGIYDDNINLDEKDKISDFYLSIDPVIVLAFGDVANRKENFLRFDYRPRIFFFADHSDNNAFEHVIRLEGQYAFRRLKIHASQEVQILDGSEVDIRGITGEVSSRVNLDVAARTELNLYTTQVDATYDFSAKTFISGGITYIKSDYPSLISSDVINGNVSLNFHYSPKLDVGVSGLVGLDRVEANPDQKYQQINARVSYEASAKLSFAATGGVEFRQFDESGRDTYVTPVFAMGATYKPFDGTTISVDAARSTYNSAVLAGQDYTSTSVRVALRQRLLRRFLIGLNGGIENSEYFGAIDGVSATRSDNYFFVEPGIDVTITRFWTVGAFYLHRYNDSSSDIFGFRANQYGIQSTLTF